MTGDRDEEEFRRDDRVRLVARLMDPAPDHPPALPSLAPSAIIERAEREPDVGRQRIGGPIVAVAILVAVIILVPAAIVTGGRGGSSPVTTSAPAVLYDGDGSASPANAELRALAEAAEAAPATRVAPVTYTRLRTWSLDLTSASPEVSVRDEQLWRTADRAGLEVTTTLPWWISIGTAISDGAPGRPQSRHTYEPGELALVVEDPSVDPPLLAAQLDQHEPFSNGPQAALRGVRDLYRHHALDGRHRAAALRVLAETPGIVFRGWVPVSVAREGAVFTADSEGGRVRDIAVFDAEGRLLVYQQCATREPGSPVTVDPFLTSMVAVLVNGTTDLVGSTAVIPS
jgi:hypothetical protein